MTALSISILVLLCVAVGYGMIRERRIQHANMVREHGHEVQFPSFRATLKYDAGRIVRVLFFGVTGIAIIGSAFDMDWSGYSTPFAQLTLSLLIGAVLRPAYLVICSMIWVKWAFTSAPKKYEDWAGFGALAIGVTLFAYLMINYPPK